VNGHAFVAILAAAVLALGAASCDQRQSDWENGVGDDWEAFVSGYEEGWDDGCALAFSGSPDGYLYDQGEQFSAEEDCYGRGADYDIDDVPDDPETTGAELGERDGCEFVFWSLPPDNGGELYWGTDSFDESVCPQ
jgi:hypothetical protein